MKKTLKIIVVSLIVLVTVLILDLVSTLFLFRPLIGIKDGNVYKGLVFNVYNCTDKKQIKSKFNKFACSLDIKEEQEVEEKVNYDIDVIGKSFCTNELNIYYDGNDKDIYFYCIDEVYVYGDDKMYTLNNFIKDNVSSLDNLLSNYYGHISFDGGSTLYKISFGDDTYNIYKCNSLSGNKNIYIGTSDMEYMCN